MELEFVEVDPALIRRSKCGQYLIEKEIQEDGTPRYCVWYFTKSIYGFKTAQEAVDEARSLDHEQAKAWQELRSKISAVDAAAKS